jgi:hypothetical protein
LPTLTDSGAGSSLEQYYAEYHRPSFAAFVNPEFANTSGIFAPMHDFGLVLGLMVWFVLGLITGRLYRGFLGGKLFAMLLFPTWMTGVYEVPRLFYWGGSRYFPVLAVTPVVCGLLALSRSRWQPSSHQRAHASGQDSFAFGVSQSIRR